jgi:hypothetical protein
MVVLCKIFTSDGPLDESRSGSKYHNTVDELKSRDMYYTYLPLPMVELRSSGKYCARWSSLDLAAVTSDNYSTYGSGCQWMS